MKQFKQLRKDIKTASTAPALLVLKRRGIRIYPDGQQVALYFNDRFNMIFTVPFGRSNLMFANSKAPISGVSA